jgi:hypothetical protein
MLIGFLPADCIAIDSETNRSKSRRAWMSESGLTFDRPIGSSFYEKARWAADEAQK